MIDPAVKLQRAESALFESVGAAFASLSDPELSALTVIEVKLSRGKKDAHIYIDGADIAADQRARLTAKLKKASGFISKFITALEGWYKSPVLHFVFDDRISASTHIEELFKKIHKDGA